MLSPFTLVPHQNVAALRSRFVLDHWRRFATGGVRSSLAGTPFETPDLVISGSPLFSRDVFDLRTPLRAYRLADDDSLFDSVTQAMRARAHADLPRYDVVFATSRLLLEKARSAGARKAVLLPNGIDLGRFPGASSAPAELDPLPRPRIVYVGAIESWFDWPTVVESARALPQASFPVVGGPRHVPSELPANIHLMGKRPHGEVAAWLQHSDVGIVPFHLGGGEAALRAIDPIKLWEYLACGLPVVASAGLDLPDLPGLVFPYRGAAEFRDALAAALERGRQPVPETVVTTRSWGEIVRRGLAEAGVAAG